jgi:acetyl-CoA carboxylase biotin carboxyl carrier protein
MAESRAPLAEVLEQVRTHALRLLHDVPRPPRSLRVRAGDVAVDVEWDGAQPAAPAATAVATPPVDGSPAEERPSGDGAPAADAYVVAPSVGVFHRSPEPGAPPFVEEGQTVEAGQQVGIVEVMKQMLPVEADRAGRIAAVLKRDGESVEFAERLFALEPVEGG